MGSADFFDVAGKAVEQTLKIRGVLHLGITEVHAEHLHIRITLKQIAVGRGVSAAERHRNHRGRTRGCLHVAKTDQTCGLSGGGADNALSKTRCRRVLEKSHYGQIARQPRHHANRVKGVAAEVEEVVLVADTRQKWRRREPLHQPERVHQAGCFQSFHSLLSINTSASSLSRLVAALALQNGPSSSRSSCEAPVRRMSMPTGKAALITCESGMPRRPAPLMNSSDARQQASAWRAAGERRAHASRLICPGSTSAPGVATERGTRPVIMPMASCW